MRSSAGRRTSCNALDVLVFGFVMVPAAQAGALERLADPATLEGPTPTRRMLIIVNPYATTMSVRLKQLVVYALQGRFEVEAVDTQRKGHATELCREAALEGYDIVVAFGGDGTVNEAANGLAGTAPRSPASPAARPTSTAACSASRPTSSTPRSTCSRLADAGSRARRPRRASTTAGSRSPPARGSTPPSSSASTATRG